MLSVLDEIEGHNEGELDTSLYTRQETPVTFEHGHVALA